MSAAVAEKPYVLHTIPGRARIHVPEWSGQGKRTIETQLRQVQGIYSAQANSLTGNILINFDPAVTNEQTILSAVGSLNLDSINEQQEKPFSLPPTIQEKQERTIRVRVAMRGLDRDPHLAKRVVERLESQPGVLARANPLTGRVLVEFEEHQADLNDLLAQVADLELPELPGEDRPAYPLDPGPLIQSMTRTVGAALGIGFLATRRLIGSVEPLPGSNVALNVASVIGVVYGIPPIRYGLRRLFGRPIADLLVSIPSIVTLTLAGSPLGLAVSGSDALRLLTEVQARQSAWRRHEERVSNAPSAQPDAVIRLENGERTPLAANVIEGTGTALGHDGMPLPVIPGNRISPGARLFGGSFLLKLQGEQSFQAFTPEPRPAPVALSPYDRYQQIAGLCSFVYAGLTAIFTRSFSRTLAALLLVNTRTAIIGRDSADLAAAARVIRAGVTVVGTRANRTICLPNLVLLDGARLLTDKFELASVLSLVEGRTAAEIQAHAASVSSAAGMPWGGVFRGTSMLPAADGTFDGKVAAATIEEVRYSLGPVEDWSEIAEAAHLRQRGNYVLVLRREHEEQPLGLVALRPQLATGTQEFVQTCQRHRVELAVLATGDQIAVRALAQRAHIALAEDDDAVRIIRLKQQGGAIVAFVSDNVGASAGFAACDLAIGITDDRSRLPARADLLAPDLIAVAAIIEAAAHREAAVRDSIGLSAASNIIGAIWGFLGELTGALAEELAKETASRVVSIISPDSRDKEAKETNARVTIETASRIVSISSLAALVDGWLRLRGGEQASSTYSTFVDPRPERWGSRSVEEVLRTLRTSENGLTSEQAAERLYRATPRVRGGQLLAVLLDQIRSPLIGLLAAGAGLSLIFGAIGDVAIIATTIAISVAMSAWQEQKANRVAEALQRMDVSYARVLRDNQAVTIPANEVVPGDILLLASGDRIAADARVISSQGLEVDEAALTGESLPVSKAPSGKNDINHIVLEGSDVTTGTGRAVVVAVGQQTCMGATRAALAENGTEPSPLGVRLSRMLSLLIPLSIVGGMTVVVTGLFWGQPLTSLLALGVTVTLAAVPEGLPLLAKVGEAGVARRLADQQAVVRRLSAVEALGRVDVACADKTGTMTRGRLQLSLVADMNHEARITGKLSPQLRHVLLAAALASPSPDAHGVKSHPTDMAVIQGAMDAGLTEQLRITHEAELPFDPVRSFHATLAQGDLYLKGAPEALLPRCRWVLQDGKKRPLNEPLRRKFISASLQFTQRGLRILMVAEGRENTSLDDPQELTALGFVGISDPLRDTVRAAVDRCRAAGVRVIMITGDHPSTARSIAQEAGLLDSGGEVLAASEIAEFQNGELDKRLERAVVIARATPLDKLRIIESLQRQGHTVAMTGDGVNDAPALRLADVGVAMGGGSTEVARQTADVVIANDDFSTLVETFVEGRSFWRNIRRALGLLLGGNLGELGLIMGASLLGAGIPLNARQILAVNAITDILPALAVALQQPEHRNLAELSREGTSALGVPLRNEILRRSIATTLPSLASYLTTLRAGGQLEARTIAFTSIITTQLAQTLDVGRSEGHLTKSVFGAVAGSLGVLAVAFIVPPLRAFLNLTIPSPMGWVLIGGGALVAVVLSRLLALPPLRNLDLTLQLPA